MPLDNNGDDYELYTAIPCRTLMMHWNRTSISRRWRFTTPKHHQTYVNNANAALENLPEFADLPVEELITKLDQVPADKKTVLRNNAGGHANHSLFWKGLKKRHHSAGRSESGYRA
ncbi:superoxide dismutase [Salmonella enterica subsp. enterica]|uniref:superoxide dismutase n=1 Tax=Salmonella enterica I TaxID=59201 RepID=A0A447N0L2_SALET|nr:superoxide dismutase [Salmonella enterica subsp. enterica]